MKGLIVKDIQLLLMNKKSFLIFAFIAVFFFITGGQDMIIFVPAYMGMMLGMMSLSTISYDDFDHSGTFLMTLPITRKMYVTGKYILSIGTIVISTILFSVISLFVTFGKQNDVIIQEWAMSSGAILAVLVLIISIMLTIELKFGSEKGRLIPIIIAAIAIIIYKLGGTIAGNLNIDLSAVQIKIMKVLTNISDTTIVLAVIALTIIITGISQMISQKIIKNKEF